jgi:hypothetical protein
VGGKYFPQNPSPTKAWYEREGGARLMADTALVANYYPTLRFVTDAETKRAVLEGAMGMLSECGIINAIVTRIDFPRTYPINEPSAYDAEARFRAFPGKRLIDRHIVPGGRCCLWLSPRSRWKADDPDALRIFLDELAVFWDRQLIYDVTGDWPGPQYDHGRDGYKQFFDEELGDSELTSQLLPIITYELDLGRNDACLCKSGKKYKKCHEVAVKDLQRRVGVDNIKHFFSSRTATDLKRGNNGA